MPTIQLVTMADIKETTKEICHYIKQPVHRKDFNDKELAFLEQMEEQVLFFKNRPSDLQIQWIYRLYYKHIEDDEEEFEKWQEEHFDTDQRLASAQPKRSW